MLVRIVDIKDKVHWINPVHVKVVTEGKKGVTSICIRHDIGWGNTVTVIKSKTPVDEVAELLNTGMPEYFAGPLAGGFIGAAYPPEDEGTDDDSGATAAVVAAG